jgi:PhnB protein
MATVLNPYITFRGVARDAMQFYQSVFGGDLVLSTFGENHMSDGPESDDLIMHAKLESPSGYVLMAADVPASRDVSFGTNMSVSLGGDEAEELTEYWQKLSDGASIMMPLAKAPWGDSFGMLTDRFGVQWLVNIAGTPAAG